MMNPVKAIGIALVTTIIVALLGAISQQMVIVNLAFGLFFGSTLYTLIWVFRK